MYVLIYCQKYVATDCRQNNNKIYREERISRVILFLEVKARMVCIVKVIM